MRKNRLSSILNNISIQLDLTQQHHIFTFINQIDPELLYYHPINCVYACLALLLETQQLYIPGLDTDQHSRIIIEKMMLHIGQPLNDDFMKNIQNIAFCWSECPQALITKIQILTKYIKIYNAYKQMCITVGEQLQINRNIIIEMMQLFWLLYLWDGKSQGTEMQQKSAHKYLMDTILLVYGKYLKIDQEKLIMEALNREFKKQEYTNKIQSQQNQIKYQFKYSNKSNEYQQPPRLQNMYTNTLNQNQLQYMKQIYQKTVSLFLQKYDMHQKYSNLGQSPQAKKCIRQLKNDLTKQIRARKTQYNKFHADPTYFPIINSKSLTQYQMSINQLPIQQSFIKIMNQQPINVQQQNKSRPSPNLAQLKKIQHQKLQIKQKKPYNHTPSSSSQNCYPHKYVTPSNLLKKFNFHASNKYNFYFGSSSITKMPQFSETIKSREIDMEQLRQKQSSIRLQLLSWIRKCVENVTPKQLAIIKQLYQFFNPSIPYVDFLQELNQKYSQIIQKFTGTCINFNNRKTQMFKFFVYFFLLTVKHFPKQQDLALLLDSKGSFGAYLTLTANIFNFCYHPHHIITTDTCDNQISMVLGQYRCEYSQYCKIFGISLLQGFKPINWVGRHIKLPSLVNDYLFYVQGNILLRDALNDQILLQKILRVSNNQKSLNSLNNSQKVTKKIVRRLKQHFILEFYAVARRIFTKQKHIRIFYPLINIVIENMMQTIAQIGYESIIFLVLLMGLALQQQTNQQYISRVIQIYAGWAQTNQHMLYFSKQVITGRSQQFYKYPITLLTYYNQIFIKLVPNYIELVNNSQEHIIETFVSPITIYNYLKPQTIDKKLNTITQQKPKEHKLMIEKMQLNKNKIQDGMQNISKNLSNLIHIAHKKQSSYSEDNDNEQRQPRKLVKRQT